MSPRQFLLSLLSLSGLASVMSQSSFKAPGLLHRARMTVNGYKIVMGVSYSSSPQVFDAYNFRVRWLEPQEWNDDGEESRRHYDLLCWVKHGEELRTLVSRRMSFLYNGYNEKFQFPSGYEAILQCKVRAINSVDLANDWEFTAAINVADIPIYLPGIEGVDLRGISTEEILNVLKKTQKEVEKEEKEQTEAIPIHSAIKQ